MALDELLETSGDARPDTEFAAAALGDAVRIDLSILQDLSAAVGALPSERDPKLRVLVRELEKVAAQAHAEATDAIDEAQKRKVLVYSFFADTVEYIWDYLQNAIGTNPRLGAWRNRIVVVTGGDDVGEVGRQAAVSGFALDFMGAGKTDDRFDLMVTTDVLAEGVNLQQCRHIINFDVP
jgi:superfamily II DNA/RNA helicase